MSKSDTNFGSYFSSDRNRTLRKSETTCNRCWKTDVYDYWDKHQSQGKGTEDTSSRQQRDPGTTRSSDEPTSAAPYTCCTTCDRTLTPSESMGKSGKCNPCHHDLRAERAPHEQKGKQKGANRGKSAHTTKGKGPDKPPRPWDYPENHDIDISNTVQYSGMGPAQRRDNYYTDTSDARLGGRRGQRGHEQDRHHRTEYTPTLGHHATYQAKGRSDRR